MFAITERLLLRPGWAEDAPALARALGDERVARNLTRVPSDIGSIKANFAPFNPFWVETDGSTIHALYSDDADLGMPPNDLQFIVAGINPRNPRIFSSFGGDSNDPRPGLGNRAAHPSDGRGAERAGDRRGVRASGGRGPARAGVSVCSDHPLGKCGRLRRARSDLCHRI